jgi:hypothetical protein
MKINVQEKDNMEGLLAYSVLLVTFKHPVVLAIMRARGKIVEARCYKPEVRGFDSR